MRRVYQLWGPVYSPASLLPETGPVPGGTTAVPRLLSAYSGLSLSPFCRLWSLILSHGSTCTRTAQRTGQQAQRCLLILVLCEVPVSSTFSHALCPALFTPGAVGMGHAAAGEGEGGCTWSASHIQPVPDSVTTFSNVHHPAMFRGHWREDETTQCLRDPDSPKLDIVENYSGMGRQGTESTHALDTEVTWVTSSCS